MRRIIALLLALALFVLLTACGGTKYSPPQNTTTSKILQITSVGDNKLVISITDKRVNTTMKENSRSKIFMHFISQKEQKMDIHIQNGGWSSFIIDNHVENDIPNGYIVSGQPNTFNLSGNQLTFEIIQMGIGRKLAECDTFLVFYMVENQNSVETIAEGPLTEVLIAKEPDATVKLLYSSDNDVLVRLSGEVIQKHLDNGDFGSLKVGFYPEGSAESQPQYEIHFPFGNDNGRKYVQASLMHLSSEEYVHLIGDSNHEAVRTKNGCSGKIYYSNIKKLLSTCLRIVITDQNRNVIAEESYQNAITLDVSSIPPIPVVFPANDSDKDFFYPVTDDYIVIMIDMPRRAFLDYGYGRDSFGEYYMPVHTHESPLKIIVILSYDEFGLSNQRAKIIYASVKDAMTAPANRLDWLSIDELTGDDSADNKIRANFFKKLDQAVFSTRSGDSSYQYFGHFDNMRYFSSRTHDLINLCGSSFARSYDRSSPFDKDGFIVETSIYDYEFQDFTAGISLLRRNTATITVFYSNAGNNRINS